MTAEALKLLVRRLTEDKLVWVANFNIEQFADYCLDRGIIVNGGAFSSDRYCRIDGQYLYID